MTEIADALRSDARGNSERKTHAQTGCRSQHPSYNSPPAPDLERAMAEYFADVGDERGASSGFASMDDLSPSNDGPARMRIWATGFVAGFGLVVTIILVLGSIADEEKLPFTIMGLIALCISAFTYTVEVTRLEEDDDEQARSAAALANYRARATEALRTELTVPSENGNRTTFNYPDQAVAEQHTKAAIDFQLDAR